MVESKTNLLLCGGNTVLVCGLVISLYSKRETINVYCAVVGCRLSCTLMYFLLVAKV